MKKLSLLFTLVLAFVWVAGCTSVTDTATLDSQQGAGENPPVAEEVYDSTTTPTESTASVLVDPTINQTEPSQQEVQKTEATSSATSAPAESSANRSTATTASQAAGRITKAEAKRIALERFGVKEQAISRYEIELDYDDDARRWEYEIGFYVGATEYDIEIDAETGKVIRAEKDNERESISTSANKTTANKTQSKTTITKAQAKATALKKAGVAEQDISRYEIELDYDDDTRRWEYEISFNVGRIEYDIVVDGTIGKVLEFEKDVD